MRPGPSVTSRSHDRDVTEGPGRTASLEPDRRLQRPGDRDVRGHLNGKSVGRKQCGRKRCTTRRGDRTLRKIVEKDRFQTLGNLRKQWTESGVETSRATVHRRAGNGLQVPHSPDTKLTSRERAKMCFKVVRCKQSSLGAEQSSDRYTFSDIVFGGEQIISSTTPCADFFFRNCLLKFQKKQLLHTNGAAKSSPDEAVRLIQKCSEVNLNIIVLWKAYVIEDNKQLILEGQHHVVLNTIGAEALSFPQKQEQPDMTLLRFSRAEHTTVAVRPSTEQLSNLIKTSLHYPESYNHPFHQKSLCVVPVTLVLSNSSQADVEVIIDLRLKTTGPEALEIHGSFTWLGQTQYKLQLKSHEVFSLKLNACFVHTGIYNLGTPRVFAKLANQVTLFETNQQSSMPALIVINNV
ncbi:unnamed protein product [Ranitomeya imitator]|uniref:Uncharacterized protein n=1 Tax=Ranitomeya imitator TaxID=111125 RepID=A0ABN9M3G8_9NEOB|nr:unnamed protein product [Ranitomeya imitator]